METIGETEKKRFMNNDPEKNKEYQRAWYNKQRGPLKIYLLTDGFYSYVGSTRNSLEKRKWQHRAVGSLTRDKIDWDKAEIKVLEETSDFLSRKSREQKWIDALAPNLNQVRAEKAEKSDLPPIYKGGIIFENVFYPTKKALWEAHGKVRFGTFKSRYFRFKNIKYALGLEFHQESLI